MPFHLDFVHVCLFICIRVSLAHWHCGRCYHWRYNFIDLFVGCCLIIELHQLSLISSHYIQLHLAIITPTVRNTCNNVLIASEPTSLAVCHTNDIHSRPKPPTYQQHKFTSGYNGYIIVYQLGVKQLVWVYEDVVHAVRTLRARHWIDDIHFCRHPLLSVWRRASG